MQIAHGLGNKNQAGQAAEPQAVSWQRATQSLHTEGAFLRRQVPQPPAILGQRQRAITLWKLEAVQGAYSVVCAGELPAVLVGRELRQRPGRKIGQPLRLRVPPRAEEHGSLPKERDGTSIPVLRTSYPQRTIHLVQRRSHHGQEIKRLNPPVVGLQHLRLPSNFVIRDAQAHHLRVKDRLASAPWRPRRSHQAAFRHGSGQRILADVLGRRVMDGETRHDLCKGLLVPSMPRRGLRPDGHGTGELPPAPAFHDAGELPRKPLQQQDALFLEHLSSTDLCLLLKLLPCSLPLVLGLLSDLLELGLCRLKLPLRLTRFFELLLRLLLDLFSAGFVVAPLYPNEPPQGTGDGRVARERESVLPRPGAVQDECSGLRLGGLQPILHAARNALLLVFEEKPLDDPCDRETLRHVQSVQRHLANSLHEPACRQQAAQDDVARPSDDAAIFCPVLTVQSRERE
eukprot:scaffold301_cov243-Pinguiococcus_pyrenoidosus.AAC.167